MKACFSALQFLSIIPVPSRWTQESSDYSVCVKYFPVIGIFLSVILGCFSWGVMNIFPINVAAVWVIVFSLVLTRGLHLDGLADSSDGFLSVSDRKRTLEIMKDSYTGVMGVAAILSILLLKFTALCSLELFAFYSAIILMVITGRCMMVLPLSILPYARKEDGLGKLFSRNKSFVNALWAMFVAMTCGGILAGLIGMISVFNAIFITILFGIYCKQKINGITGDTLGATCEISETVVVLTFSACAYRGGILG